MATTIPTARFVHRLLPARDWQNRPEFGQLCAWWCGSSNPQSAIRNPQWTGVCALVGIGGAGKTAIAERFLRVLPGGLPAPEATANDNTTPPPSSLFVFSFYEAPNPDHFFTQLYAWLNDTQFDESAKAPSYQQTLQLLGHVGQTCQSAGSGNFPVASSPKTELKCPGNQHDEKPGKAAILLILDGLEKVQDDGERGGALGQLLDGRLRDLILRAADGYLPGVTLLITTRFRLFDPLTQRSALYRQIDIDQLQPPVALALLRARGVLATEVQLLALAEESGFHALTLDLLGGYVAAFCGGDPACLPPLAEVKVPDEAAVDEPRLAAVMNQERKFGRLAQRYREVLAARDPAALALMERVCLFRLGVNADTLAAIFTGAGKETVSGPALAALNNEQVRKKLRMLTQMYLLDESQPPSPLNAQSSHTSPNYTVHPAVRDGFRLKGKDAAYAHDAIREKLRIKLKDRPAEDYPFDTQTLDLVEEIIFHTLAAGYPLGALQLYQRTLGGFINLGWRLTAHLRGERICRSMLEGRSPRTALQNWRSRLHTVPPHFIDTYRTVCWEEQAVCSIVRDWAMHLRELGQLRDAAHCVQRVVDVFGVDLWTQINLAFIHVLEGQLSQGIRELSKISPPSQTHSYRDEGVYFYALHARVYCLLGATGSAEAAFKSARSFELGQQGSDIECLFGIGGIWRALWLTRLGRIEEAGRQITVVEGFFRESANEITRGSFYVVAAEVARLRGDTACAEGWCRRAFEWAVLRDATDVLCGSFLVQARMNLNLAVGVRGQLDGLRPDSDQEFACALTSTATALDEGLHITRDCGYGIFHIDLLLERARLHLLRGEPQLVLDDLRVALDDGIHPPADSGFPTLLAANDPECGYAWGIAEGRHLRAQAFLLQAAQILGRPDFAPANFEDLPAKVRSLVEFARKELKECRALRKRIQDPKIKETQATLDRLDKCQLTDYPLERRNMKVFDWITNGLSAATAAMSTAPPDQWADGRVVGVATSTFLLGALQARRAERENASRDEVIASVRKGLQDFEEWLAASEAGKARWTTELKESLSQQLTAVALNVEACQGRIADLDRSVGSILQRLTSVEEFVHSYARSENVLVGLVEHSFKNFSLPTQNHIHDILDGLLNLAELSVLAQRCGVDWDNLVGGTKSEKAMALIKECRNAGRFAKLIEEIERKRAGALGLQRRVAEVVVEVRPAAPNP